MGIPLLCTGRVVDEIMKASIGLSLLFLGGSNLIIQCHRGKAGPGQSPVIERTVRKITLYPDYL